MTKGDNVIINHNNKFKTIATFLEKENNKNLFFDKSGKFFLSDEFISKNSITFSVVED